MLALKKGNFMLKKINHKNMGASDLGWLKSLFHFSFAEYYNPKNMNFGVLRVVNDDLVNPSTGFDTHPHKDMEIISYVIEGALTHGDSMGNRRTLTRGDVQYMSAGRGVYHSEHNFGTQTLRFLQIWIMPDAKNHQPNYGDFQFEWDARKNHWFQIVSSKEGNAPIKINQDINISVLSLDGGKVLDFDVKQDRQAYLIQIEGKSSVNQIELNERDALEILEEKLEIESKSQSHFIILEMKKV